MICNGCDKIRDDMDLMRCVITEKKEFLTFARCCVRPKAGMPDVFWDGKPEINLADGPDGKPRVFSSKGEKAAYLKSKGIVEAGDPVRGAPVMLHKAEAPKKDGREEVKKALRTVKQMSPDYRRNEYLRIKHEGQRA